MSKLSLEALQMRAEVIASEDLLATISGGTENACHNVVAEAVQADLDAKRAQDDAAWEMYQKIGRWISDLFD